MRTDEIQVAAKLWKEQHIFSFLTDKGEYQLIHKYDNGREVSEFDLMWMPKPTARTLWETLVQAEYEVHDLEAEAMIMI